MAGCAQPARLDHATPDTPGPGTGCDRPGPWRDTGARGGNLVDVAQPDARSAAADPGAEPARPPLASGDPYPWSGQPGRRARAAIGGNLVGQRFHLRHADHEDGPAPSRLPPHTAVPADARLLQHAVRDALPQSALDEDRRSF